ncbi:IS1/IS1595 family N-terminal zinc-binding domain-containing protein, partial [Parathermosynechococcus lividus]
MECPLCGHPKAHKHGKMPNGHQRYLCPTCNQT